MKSFLSIIPDFTVMKLKFLGTGGGRYVTGLQDRRTGGIIVKTEETQIHVDPGPGALVYTHQEFKNPLDTEAVIVSHAHLDHSSDAEPIIEMITETASKPGAIFANETALHGYGDIEKRISNYHQDLCVKVEQLEQGTVTNFKDLEIKSQEMFHGDPKTVGFILEDNKHSVGFWTDSEYSKELLEFYEECDVMIIYCTRPKEKSIASHTSVDEVTNILDYVEPNTAIITHFGKAFLNSNLEDEEDWLKNKTESKIIFAEDFMEFPGNRSLTDF